MKVSVMVFRNKSDAATGCANMLSISDCRFYNKNEKDMSSAF